LPAAIAWERVSKRYTPHGPWALQGVTLEIPPGAVVVLIGPPGAGKTTLLKLGLGLLFPTEGRVTVLGTEDLETVRSRIGYLPQNADYHLVFTAREYLRWLGRLRGIPAEELERRVLQLLGRLDLSSHAEERLSAFSPDLLQRLGLAQALLADPPLVFLDEPTARLEAEGEALLEVCIQELQAQGKTCLLTSRNLENAARLATHLGLLQQGRLVDFREWSTDSILYTFSLAVPPLPSQVQQALEKWDVTYDAEAGELWVKSASDHVPEALLRLLLDHGVPPRAMTPRGLSLPEIYQAALEEDSGGN